MTIVVFPSDDVEGQWIGHSLDFDVVSMGNSPSHALQMVSEATSLVLLDDLHNGIDSTKRRAPHECWNQLLVLRSLRGSGRVFVSSDPDGNASGSE